MNVSKINISLCAYICGSITGMKNDDYDSGIAFGLLQHCSKDFWICNIKWIIFQGRTNFLLKRRIVNPYQASHSMFLPWAENDIAVTEAAWGCIFMIISTFPRSNILMVPSLYPAAQCDGWMTASSAGWGCGWTVVTVCPSFVIDLVGKTAGTGLNDTQLQLWKKKNDVAIVITYIPHCKCKSRIGKRRDVCYICSPPCKK